MTFTIKAIDPKTRNYSTRYGEMTSYKVLFNEMDQPVEISQKSTTPAPAIGDALEGTVDMSGQYGPKFKKEYNPQGGGNFGQPQSQPTSPTPNSTGAGGSKTSGFKNDDPFTM